MKTFNYAILNNRDELTGFKQLDPTNTSQSHIQVPDNCDLKPGQYRYSRENRRFEPITKKVIPFSQNEVKAIADGFNAIYESGLIELPQNVIDWIKEAKLISEE